MPIKGGNIEKALLKKNTSNMISDMVNKNDFSTFINVVIFYLI